MFQGLLQEWGSGAALALLYLSDSSSAPLQQTCDSKHKQQWLQSCHTVPPWLLRDLCIYLNLVLPTLPGSCWLLSPSLRLEIFMVAGRLVKITLWLGMFSNTFAQKEIPQEEVVFASKWVIQHHSSFPSPFLNKKRVGTMVQYAEHIRKVFTHSERKSSPSQF